MAHLNAEICSEFNKGCLSFAELVVMLGWKAIFTLVVVALMFIVLASNKFNDTLVIFLAYILLWVVTQMSSNDALGGLFAFARFTAHLLLHDAVTILIFSSSFANSGLITVGALFVLVHTMGRTPVVSNICHKAFGNSSNPKLGMARFLTIVNILSAFFNNTPLVALMMPIVRDWARSRNFPSSHPRIRSKFLIPLSFAAITGGMLTSIGSPTSTVPPAPSPRNSRPGTSTTLLILGYLAQAKVASFSFFEVGYIGLPIAVISIMYLMTFGFWVLPDTGSGMLGQAQKGSEEFVTEIAVGDDFKGIGNSIYSQLTAEQVLDKLKISRSSLLEVWRVNPRHQESSAPTLSELQNESDQVAISGAAEAVASGSAQHFAVTSGPDGLRLNLPSLPDLAVLPKLHAADTPASTTPHAYLRRQSSKEEPSTVRAMTASVPPLVLIPEQGQEEEVIELEDLPFGDDAADLQSLLSSHLNRDYTKLESTQINEGNILRSGDRLILSAKLENLQHLRQVKGKGLSIGDSVIDSFHDVDSEFVELVVSHRCPHVGRPINSRDIRLAYNFGGIVGVRRHGISLSDIMMDTKLATGDTLLVVASASNLSSYQNSKDFYVACSVGGVPRKITWWDYMPIINFLIMIILPATDVIPMEQSAMLFASICFICGWVTPVQALEVIDFSLLIMIASSIGISRAMELSGVSKALGDWIKDSQFTPWSANCLMYFIALILTEIVTNNAAAAITIPIALSAAKAMEVSHKPFAMSVIMASSLGFAIPFGYACHLMVMGPGGYTLAHFVKIGLPLDVVIWLLCSWLIPLIWPF